MGLVNGNEKNRRNNSTSCCPSCVYINNSISCIPNKNPDQKLHSTNNIRSTLSLSPPQFKEPKFVTMADQGVKLIGVWGSPFSRRVEIALKLKGIKYEFLEEDLSNKSPLLLKYNPVHKKVPVLLHNGKPIAESLVIVEYIDEAWKSGPPILPTDPYGRAMARFWAKFIDDKCLPAIWKVRRSQGEERTQAIDESFELLKILENELGGKKFFGGENIGFVDIAANFVGLWLGIIQEMLGIELMGKEKLPKLCEWTDNYLNCDIIKQSLPPRDELAARLRALFQPK